MNRPSTTRIVLACGLAVALIGAVGWLCGQLLPADSMTSRFGLEAAKLIVAMALAGWLFARFAADSRRTQSSLDRLCNLNYRELCQEAPESDDESSPGESVVERMRRTLAKLAQQLREAEDGRTALELRARRAAIEQDRMQAVLAGLSDPALVIDEFGQVVSSNTAAESLLEFEASGGAKQPAAALVRHEALAELLHDMARRRAPTARTCDVEYEHEPGRKRSYRVTVRSHSGAFPHVDGDGEKNGVVAIFRDISSEREAGRRHAEFVSAVSHEMKAPLAGIKAYVELLADGDVTDESIREEFLGVINGQADRLQRLIDNLLNLARIESGVVKVTKECRSLNELLLEALDVVRPSAESKKIELKAELSPMYLNALVDRDQISQAAINLLSNAVKYTPPEGAVTLRSRSLDDKVQFDVEDSGVGISPEDCQNVFRKFYRVKAHSSMAPGTGLGLPLAKSIIEEVHGGTLSVKSELGKGSTFTVTLASAGTMR